jgi:hypothetical protein
MTGEELRQLLLDKWGCSFDIRLRKSRGTVFVQIMWKYLEQQSFPLSESEYLAHLDAIANYLNAWSAQQQFRDYLQETGDHPRVGKVVNIPLELGERASEWII